VAQQSPGPAAEQGPEPAGPPRPPAHTGARAWHWTATAAVLAAAVGTVLAVAPADASAPVPNGPHAIPAAAAPDPARAVYPLVCAGMPVKVAQSFSADLTGNGTDATIAAAHCLAGAGTPPDGLFLLEPGSGGRPRVADVLIRATEDLTVRSVEFHGDGTITADVDGYSSLDVPTCCPDVHESLVWTPHDGGYRRTVVLTGDQA